MTHIVFSVRRALLRWLYAVGLGLDITLNAIFGGRPWETISARTHRIGVHNGEFGDIPWSIARVVDWIAWEGNAEIDHCRMSHTVWRLVSAASRSRDHERITETVNALSDVDGHPIAAVLDFNDRPSQRRLQS